MAFIQHCAIVYVYNKVGCLSNKQQPYFHMLSHFVYLLLERAVLGTLLSIKTEGMALLTFEGI